MSPADEQSGGAGPRDTFASFRERLDALGFRPSRRLGQNFLLDPTLHRAIVEAADLDEDTVALEIGVGLGFLTRELVVPGRCGRVVAVEIDERLASVVEEDRRHWPGAGDDRFRLVRTDALGPGGQIAEPVLEALARARCELRSPSAGSGSASEEPELAVVANLPYAVSGPLLAALVTMERPPDTVVALVQRELAERVVQGGGGANRAGGGGNGVGAPTILVGRFYDARIVRQVGREVFRPRPNVDSAVLRLRRAVDSWPARGERLAFSVWLRALFARRRKTMANAVRHAGEVVGAATVPESTAAALGALAGCRPEELDPAAHWRVFEALAGPGRRAPEDGAVGGIPEEPA